MQMLLRSAAAAIALGAVIAYVNPILAADSSPPAANPAAPAAGAPPPAAGAAAPVVIVGGVKPEPPTAAELED